jgi:hypothetical protein
MERGRMITVFTAARHFAQFCSHFNPIRSTSLHTASLASSTVLTRSEVTRLPRAKTMLLRI